MPRLGCSTRSSTGSASVRANAHRKDSAAAAQSLRAAASKPCSTARTACIRGGESGAGPASSAAGFIARGDRAPNAESDAAGIAGWATSAASTPTAASAVRRTRS
ncbi:hypothetical protein ACH4ND_22635 [Streptomyces sp. NPDC017179]|uniref:hypothetical protein n=1 Tax=Streptomyces sp. NPDC017179 TaxID=3364979 RepID=UPI0037B7FBD8